MQERKLYTKEIFLATIMIVNRIINDFQVANGIYYKKGKKQYQNTRVGRWIPPERGSHELKVDASLSRTRAKGAVGVPKWSGELCSS